MTHGESETFLWTTGGVCNLVYSDVALTMGFVFLVEEKKKEGKKTVL